MSTSPENVNVILDGEEFLLSESHIDPTMFKDVLIKEIEGTIHANLQILTDSIEN